MDNLIENDQIVEALARTLFEGEGGLNAFPGLLKRVIREKMWRRRVIRNTGEIVEFERFTDFVREYPPQGLGADVDILRRLCAKDNDAREALDLELKNPVGRPSETVYNIHNSLRRSAGTSSEASLSRLRNAAYVDGNEEGEIKDARIAELHRRAKNNELAPNAAVLEAGFRTRKVSVNMDNPDSAARTLRKYMDADNLRRLIALLSEE